MLFTHTPLRRSVKSGSSLGRYSPPKELPVKGVEEDLRSQNFLAQVIRRILNQSRELLDLVLVTGTAEANDNATKTAFFIIKSVGPFGGRAVAGRRRRGAVHYKCTVFEYLTAKVLRKTRSETQSVINKARPGAGRNSGRQSHVGSIKLSFLPRSTGGRQLGVLRAA
ncbi:hypothetical protein EVAR_66272_1 [Eumeta japonica]|uniref:Uncharacterized protein n=1 Tax=Eumeta variegata TaxID=151549 RepID=A0A4C1ZTC5_EUMVA|nr:hypothetical protein EVAR_66272_1 [Eumeta japonica]